MVKSFIMVQGEFFNLTLPLDIDMVSQQQIVVDTFKPAMSLESLRLYSIHSRRFFRLHYPTEYAKQLTYPQLKENKSGGASGNLNSALSNFITNQMFYYLMEHNYTIFQVDKDGIDYEIRTVNGIIDGDVKMGVSNIQTSDKWTGNGCSQKRGFYVLFKFHFMGGVALSKIYISTAYCGVIHSNYVQNKRKSREGSSDMSTITIPNEHWNKLTNIFGSSHQGKNGRMVVDLDYVKLDTTYRDEFFSDENAE